jgi:CubicO group peptidase (beta-lactamase class C family)
MIRLPAARNKGLRLSLLAAAVVAALPQLAVAAPSKAAAEARISRTGIDPLRLRGLADFVDGVMAQQIASREIAGAVVTVVHDGKILFTRGYGSADIDRGRPVDPLRTLFRPGSVSKLFTWTALMQQVELGRVSLDADVNDYIDFKIPPFRGQPISVRNLMQHSVGMSDVGGIITREPKDLPDYRSWIKAHIPERLWEPGKESAYSNYGVALAGYIVERVSGERFEDYTDRHIFQPLGMTSSTFREPLPAPLQANMALGYKLVDGQFVAQPYEFVRAITPAGAAAATGPDMGRFMLALLNRGRLGKAQILKPASVALLFSDSLSNAPHLPGMAHGFFVYQKADPRLLGHGGNTGDFHSNLVLAPEKVFGFFVSTSGGQGSSVGRTDLTEALIGRMFPQRPAPTWAGIDNPAPPSGSYRSNRRDHSRPARPEYDLKVSMPERNRLVTETTEGKLAWRQIGPYLYEQVTGAREGGPFNRLEFYGLPDDPRLSFSNGPYQTFRYVKP